MTKRGYLDGASLTKEGHNLVLECDYDEEFVDALKHAIPIGSRRWLPGRKAWVIDAHYARTVRALVRDYLGEVLTLPKEKP